MPQDDPGSLSEQQVLGIVAYLTMLNTGASPTASSANALNSIMVAPERSSAQ
jgi:hypothetical protein